MTGWLLALAVLLVVGAVAVALWAVLHAAGPQHDDERAWEDEQQTAALREWAQQREAEPAEKEP